VGRAIDWERRSKMADKWITDTKREIMESKYSAWYEEALEKDEITVNVKPFARGGWGWLWGQGQDPNGDVTLYVKELNVSYPEGCYYDCREHDNHPEKVVCSHVCLAKIGWRYRLLTLPEIKLYLDLD